MPYFSNIKRNDLKLTFELNNNNISPPLTNALRRVMIAEIPVLAVDRESVIFNKNTSMLHNDFLLNRITFLPIQYQNISKNIQEIIITLNVNNETDEMKTIYTKDFNITYQNSNLPTTQFFTEDNFIFCKLKPGQEVSLEANIQLGTPKQYDSSFSPVCKSIIYFKRDQQELDKLTKNMKPEEKQIFLDIEGDRHYMKTPRGEPKVYIFDIESVGQMTPNQVFSTSISELKLKITYIINAISNQNHDKIEINKTTKIFEGTDFLLFDEEDTFGNLIVSYLNYKSNIKYAGYVVLHPNDNKMMITLSLTSNNSIQECTKVFVDTLKEINGILDKLNSEWKNVKTPGATGKKKIIKKKVI